MQPQVSYSVHMFGFKQRFTFSLWTVPVPAIIGGHICSDAGRALLILAVKFGGYGLPNLCNIANIELLHSKKITRELYENIITQNKDFQIDSEKTKTRKNKLKTSQIIISN